MQSGNHHYTGGEAQASNAAGGRVSHPACFARCRLAAAGPAPYTYDSTHLGGRGPPLLPLLREWRNLTLAAARPDRDADPPASPSAPLLLQTVQRASFRLLLPQARYSALGDARFSRPRSPLTPGRICRGVFFSWAWRDVRRGGAPCRTPPSTAGRRRGCTSA